MRRSFKETSIKFFNGSLAAFGRNLNRGLVYVLSAMTAWGLTACGPREAGNESNLGSSGESIIGGTEVSPTSRVAQSTVALFDVRGGQLCTGSLIAPNIVLSAAHCIGRRASDMAVIFSADAESLIGQDQFGLSLFKNPKVRGVKKIALAPTWATQQNADKDTGDISLLLLDGDAPAGFVPAKLLASNALLRKGTSVILAGYGITNGREKTGTAVLRQVRVRVADPKFAKTEVLLDQTLGRGACHGDSGGPAFVQSGNQLLLWGITSRGEQDTNDDCSKYAVYTNAVAYNELIKSAITQLTNAELP